MGKAADFSFVRHLVRHTYSDTGAPSVDPTVVFKIALLGYLYGISSERQLAREIRLNLAYLWFLGYDLDEIPPDHSILSKARARYGPQAYRQFFFEIVRRCREEELIQGDRLYLDASLVRADASIESPVSRPLYRQLADVDDYVRQLWTENETLKEPGGNDVDPPPPPPSDTDKPEKLTANERRVSRTDPEAAIIADRLKGLFLARKVHIGVDGGAARVITAVVATPGDRPEGHQVELLIGQHFWLTGRKPDEVVADRGYSYTRVYEFLRRQRILPTIPRRKPWRNTAAKRGRLGFVYVPELDRYRCPKGKWLYNVRIPDKNNLLYRTHSCACGKCDLKPECTCADRCSMTRPADMATRRWVDDHLATARAKRAVHTRPSLGRDRLR